MLSKCAEKIGTSSSHMSYLLTEQPFSCISIDVICNFHLSALTVPSTPYMVDLQDYLTELTTSLSDAWLATQEHVPRTQAKQKQQYDKHTRESPVKVGERVMVHKFGSVKGKARKLVRPFHGLYRVLPVTPTNAMLKYENQEQMLYLSLSAECVHATQKFLMCLGAAAANPVRTKSEAAKTLLLHIK